MIGVHALSRRFTKEELLNLAREVDCGFDTRVFIEMLRYLDRYGDVDVPALRAFFQHWVID